jgi:DNA-directed RNA polymerase specialized sigma24 family protein
VLLHCVANETDYADYGARIGLHPLAVKTRCYRARHRLASLLTEPAGAASRAPAAAAGATTRARRRPR